MSLLCSLPLVATLFACAPPPAKAKDEPPPARFTIGTVTHDIAVPAIRTYGATPLADYCRTTPREEEPAANYMRDQACAPEAKGEHIVMFALVRLSAARAKQGEDLESAIRDVNGLLLAGFAAGVQNETPDLVAERFEDIGETVLDARLYDISADFWQVDLRFCKPDDAACRTYAQMQAAKMLVAAGRGLNDKGRLLRGGESAEQMERSGTLDAEDLLSARNIAGRAYSYAAAFVEGKEALALMNRSIAVYERALPRAEELAPSFDSAMIWQNLGAGYVDRAALINSESDFQRGVALYEKAIGWFEPQRKRNAVAVTRSNIARAKSQMASLRADLALHDEAIDIARASIAGFETGDEALEVAFGRYRLAQNLLDKARTAEIRAAREDTQDSDRPALRESAIAGRKAALHEVAEAREGFKAARADVYDQRAAELETAIRAGLRPPAPPKPKAPKPEAQ
ncbi:hypothetical protein ACLBXM_15825 [Xanthobacteraceae bacterium A53D]